MKIVIDFAPKCDSKLFQSVGGKLVEIDFLID
jgi:hypothetical protein